LVDDAFGVAEHDVRALHAHDFQELDAGDRGGAGAIDHELGRVQGAAREMQRVDQAGGGDDRGAVLVVVEHGDVEEFAQALLDHEAFRRLDVFEVDPAKGLAEEPHAVDELVYVLGVDFEVDAVDVGEALEQHRLAFHHRLGAECAEIAQAQHGGAVGDHRHHVTFGRVVVRERRIARDLETRRGDARRVGERQVALGGERLGGVNLDLARPAGGVHAQRLLVDDLIWAVSLIVHGASQGV